MAAWKFVLSEDGRSPLTLQRDVDTIRDAWQVAFGLAQRGSENARVVAIGPSGEEEISVGAETARRISAARNGARTWLDLLN